MDIVFVADAHLKGLEDPNQQRLVKFLDTLPAVDALVILGDLFDFWTGFNEVVYYHYLPTCDALRRLKEKGLKIVYLEGNHDFSMGSFFTSVLGAAVYPDTFELNCDGRRMLLAHGDTISMTPGYFLWRSFLRSKTFRIITRIVTPGLVWKVAGFLSRKSRGYSKKGDMIEERLREFARGELHKGMDAVILAHSHVPGVYREEASGGKRVYANPGSWANDSTYLVYSNGEFTVKKFSGAEKAL